MPRVKWIRPPYTRGLPPEQRFWSYVEKTDGCWLWRGSRTRTGPDTYGGFDVDGRTVRAHRYSYALAHGPFDARLLVCHTCDNPQCVRPEHLFLGTAKDNAADRDRKGRRTPAAGERHGMAKLSSEDVYAIRLMAGEGWLHREIAEHFPITRTHVSRVVKGECRAAA